MVKFKEEEEEEKPTLFDSIKEALSNLIHDDISTVNFVFKLHRTFTVIPCLNFAIILTIAQVRSILKYQRVCICNELKRSQ